MIKEFAEFRKLKLKAHLYMYVYISFLYKDTQFDPCSDFIGMAPTFREVK